MAGGSADIGIRVFLDDAASQALGSINGALARMVGTTQTASRAMGGLSSAMAGVGVAVGFAAVFAAIAAAVGASVKAASDFQQAMFGVAVATHVPMTTAMQYANTLMNLAASSTYSSAQIAEGIVQMGRAGYSIQDIFGRMATAGIALGIATRSTAVQGFTLLTQAMRAYNAPAADAMHYADLLQFAFEHQRGSVSDLTSAFSQVLPEASRFHVGLNEVIAALDTFGPAMASSSRAGTALRYMLDGLYSPTAGAEKELVALGLASVDAGGNFHSAFYNNRGQPIDFAAAVHLLNGKLSTMNEEARNEALHKLFSVKGGQGVSDMLQMLSQFDNYLGQVNNKANTAGLAMRRWQEIMQTLGGAWAGLRSSITDLAVVIGSMLLPTLTNAANQLNGFISHIRSIAQSNPAATASFLKLGAALSAVGLVATIVLLAIAGIGTGILLFVGIVLGVVAGVILLTVAIMAAVNWFRQLYASSALVRGVIGALGAVFNEIGAQIRGTFAGAIAYLRPQLQSMMQALNEAGAALRPLLPILGMLAAVILGVVIGAIRGLVLAFMLFVTGLALVIIGLVTVASGIIQVFMGLFTVIRGIFSLNTAMILQGFTMMGQGILRIIQGAFQVIQGVIIGVLGAIIGFVIGFVQGFISWFVHLASVIVGHSIVPDMMNAIRNVVAAGLAAVVSAVIAGVASIIAQFVRMGAMVISTATNAWNSFRSVVSSGIAAAVSLVSSGASNMVSRVVALGASIISNANSAWNGFKTATSNGINNAVSTVSGGVARIIGVVSSLPGKLYTWGKNAMQSFADGLGSALGAVVDKVASAARSVANFLAHTSPAKMGPLSQDDKWMPNMMNMFASQIESHTPLLTSALNRSFGSMSAVPQMARAGGPIPTAPMALGGGGGSRIVQLVVNGHILGQAVMDDFTTQLQLNGGGRAFR